MSRSKASRMNPLEQLTIEMADVYADLVFELVPAIAPYRPWWQSGMTPDQQLWRWMQQRDGIIEWLGMVAPSLGWQTLGDAIANLAQLFTGPIEDRVPPEVLIDPKGDALKALVQAVGPHDAAEHIKRMEILVSRRMAASASLQPVSEPTAADLPIQPGDPDAEMPQAAAPY
jgi:hypothetical protein